MMLTSNHYANATCKPPGIRRSRLRVTSPHACLRCAQQQSLQLLQGVRMQTTSPAQCCSSGRALTTTLGQWPLPPGQPVIACAADPTISSSHATSSGRRMHAASAESGSSQQGGRSQHHQPSDDPGAAASAERQESPPETPSTASSEQAPASSSAQPEPPEHDSLGVRMALSALRFYKEGISPLMPSVCRFLPTCSQYSADAYKCYGVARGTVLTAWRLLRCNPWGGRGYDPVTWPPPGLPAAVFQVDGSAEVAVVAGIAAFVWLVQSALFG